jgi:hypothetical protein
VAGRRWLRAGASVCVSAEPTLSLGSYAGDVKPLAHLELEMEEVRVMPGWVWVLIAVVVVVLVALVAWQAVARRRSDRLQEQFGPEYDRTVGSAQSKRDAEAELQAREERRQELEIRPLSQAAHDRYLEGWQTVQAQFVDNPDSAVASADVLIQSVMEDRGYPVEDFEQRSADISVDHPRVVENYRQGRRLAEANVEGNGSTEDLRQAMRNYRALFEELVEPAAEQPMSRDRDANGDSASSDPVPTRGREGALDD